MTWRVAVMTGRAAVMAGRVAVMAPRLICAQRNRAKDDRAQHRTVQCVRAETLAHGTKEFGFCRRDRQAR